MIQLRFMHMRRKAAIGVLTVVLAALAGCGGGSGDDDGPDPDPDPGPSPTNVTISGKVTFDRIEFKTSGAGLDPGAPVESPARQITVEALDASAGDAILATATTNDSGDYSLQVPSNRNVKMRAKAQMVRTGSAPTWNVRVLNNTNGNALYALDGTAASSGTANGTRNLRATSGWGTTSYTGTRAAAPFAILDTVYSAQQLILQSAASATFPALDLYWSTSNRPSTGLFCTTNGNIGTTFYTGGAGAGGSGNCTPNVALPAGIYVLGDFAGGSGDTDEFDQHVIAHEYGHYFEDQFSRSDSVGGSHSLGDHLDLRVAFGEGWGNAYSAMVLNDPEYRDSQNGVAAESSFDLETGITLNEGWFSEFSAGEILWDLFDAANDGADTVSMGFTPLYAVLTGPQRTTPALTSIFSFADALRAANNAQVAGINALLESEAISTNSDAFGSGETNNGGVVTALPIYQTITTGQQLIVCSSSDDGSQNKLGYRRFLLMNVTAATAVTITATGVVDPGNGASLAATDPDIYVYRSGELVAAGNALGVTETIDQRPLAAGLHVIEVYDYDATGPAQRCMSVSVTGL